MTDKGLGGGMGQTGGLGAVERGCIMLEKLSIFNKRKEKRNANESTKY